MGQHGGGIGTDGQSDAQMLQPVPFPPNAFHRQLSQQQSQQQAQQLIRASAKLPNVRKYQILIYSRIFWPDQTTEILKIFVIQFKNLFLLQPTSRRQLAVAAAGLAVATDDGTIGKLIIMLRSRVFTGI